MSLLNKASLIQIPSGYKDGTLYSAKPTNGDGDFTFSRGSNLAATRVNSEGLIEKGRENLLLQSNSFDTTWDTSGTITLTSGQSDKDGEMNAWKLAKGSASAFLYQSNTTNAVQTFSIYAKADTSNWIMFQVSGIASVRTFFDLENGALGSSLSNVIDANIESVGNGWYRCSMIYNGNPGNIRVFVADGNNDTSGTSGSVFIMHSQLELGLVATDYIETGASTAQAGILEDMPRLDYSGGASCGHLLLEPQRSNLYTNSEYYDGYTQANLTIATNATTSPEGLQNASKLVSSSGTSIKRIQPSITTSSATDYIISAFVKKAEWDYVFIYGDGTLSSGQNAIWDLENGTITQGSGHSTIESFGQGWYKITWKATASGAGSAAPRIGITDNSTGVNSTGDGTSGVFLYGLQIEEGSYPTSYIPTYGASVTRSADYMTVTPTNLLGSTTGSWFMELDDMTFETTGTSVPTIYLGDDLSNCLALEARASGQNKTIDLVKEESGTVTTLHSFTISGTTKFCFVWDGTTLKVFVDGVEEYSSTSFTQPTNWDTFVYNHTGREAFSEINSVLLFPTALTDDEAIALTTI